MTELQQLKAGLFDLPREQMRKVVEAKGKIEAILMEYSGEGLGFIALAWAGLEAQEETY